MKKTKLLIIINFFVFLFISSCGKYKEAKDATAIQKELNVPKNKKVIKKKPETKEEKGRVPGAYNPYTSKINEKLFIKLKKERTYINLVPNGFRLFEDAMNELNLTRVNRVNAKLCESGGTYYIIVCSHREKTLERVREFYPNSELFKAK